MEGSCQFQGRILRDPSRRVGWAYAGRLRRSTDHPQVLFDASCFRIRGPTSHCGRGSRPRRTRGNRLAGWTETQVMVDHRLRPTDALTITTMRTFPGELQTALIFDCGWR